MLDKAGPGAASPALDSALVNGAGEALGPAALDVLLLMHLFVNACWRQAQASAKSSADLQLQGGTWLFHLAVGATQVSMTAAELQPLPPRPTPPEALLPCSKALGAPSSLLRQQAPGRFLSRRRLSCLWICLAPAPKPNYSSLASGACCPWPLP